MNARRLTILGLVLSVSLVSSALAVSYVTKSNTSKLGFSLNTGLPVYVIIPSIGGNGTVAQFTVTVMDTIGQSLDNLYLNTTLTQYPPDSGPFILNETVGGPGWILGGPFSLQPNIPVSFQLVLVHQPVYGFYEVAVNVVQLGP